MLKNLTTKSFSPYGTILNGDIQAAGSVLSVSLIKRRVLSASSFVKAYVNFEAKTAIEKAEGTAILFCGKTPTCLSDIYTTHALNRLIRRVRTLK